MDGGPAEDIYGRGATSLAGAPAAVRAPAAVLTAIAAEMRRALPAEGCGLLGGRLPAGRGPAGGETAALLLGFAALRNEAGAASRFAVAPADFVRAVAHLERLGLRPIGFVHSHPGGTTALSAVDRRELWRGHVHLIAAPRGRQPRDPCPLAAHWIDAAAGCRELPLLADLPAAAPGDPREARR